MNKVVNANVNGHGFVQVFKNRRRFNRFTISAFQDGFDLRSVTVVRLFLRTLIVATYVACDHVSRDSEEVCQRCEVCCDC